MNERYKIFYRLFATYDVAFKLKSIGFNDKCFGYYDEKKELVLHEKPYAFWTTNEHNNWNHAFFKKGKENICSAPLWEQVYDWFGVKGILISFDYNTRFNNTTTYIFDKNVGKYLSISDAIDGFITNDIKEKAILKAIEKWSQN